jgi:hypothetical protein
MNQRFTTGEEIGTGASAFPSIKMRSMLWKERESVFWYSATPAPCTGQVAARCRIHQDCPRDIHIQLNAVFSQLFSSKPSSIEDKVHDYFLKHIAVCLVEDPHDQAISFLRRDLV